MIVTNGQTSLRCSAAPASFQETESDLVEFRDVFVKGAVGTSPEYVQFGIPDAGLQTLGEPTREQIELPIRNLCRNRDPLQL